MWRSDMKEELELKLMQINKMVESLNKLNTSLQTDVAGLLMGYLEDGDNRSRKSRQKSSSFYDNDFVI